MLKIYKYPVPVDDQWHDLALTGMITHIGPDPFRNDVIYVWAIHSDSAQSEGSRRFRVFGTGHELPANTRPENVLGSVQTRDGQFVWHLVDTWYPDNP